MNISSVEQSALDFQIERCLVRKKELDLVVDLIKIMDSSSNLPFLIEEWKTRSIQNLEDESREFVIQAHNISFTALNYIDLQPVPEKYKEFESRVIGQYGNSLLYEAQVLEIERELSRYSTLDVEGKLAHLEGLIDTFPYVVKVILMQAYRALLQSNPEEAEKTAIDHALRRVETVSDCVDISIFDTFFKVCSHFYMEISEEEIIWRLDLLESKEMKYQDVNYVIEFLSSCKMPYAKDLLINILRGCLKSLDKLHSEISYDSVVFSEFVWTQILQINAHLSTLTPRYELLQLLCTLKNITFDKPIFEKITNCYAKLFVSLFHHEVIPLQIAEYEERLSSWKVPNKLQLTDVSNLQLLFLNYEKILRLDHRDVSEVTELSRLLEEAIAGNFVDQTTNLIFVEKLSPFFKKVNETMPSVKLEYKNECVELLSRYQSIKLVLSCTLYEKDRNLLEKEKEDLKNELQVIDPEDPSILNRLPSITRNDQYATLFIETTSRKIQSLRQEARSENLQRLKEEILYLKKGFNFKDKLCEQIDLLCVTIHKYVVLAKLLNNAPSVIDGLLRKKNLYEAMIGSLENSFSYNLAQGKARFLSDYLRSYKKKLAKTNREGSVWSNSCRINSVTNKDQNLCVTIREMYWSKLLLERFSNKRTLESTSRVSFKSEKIVYKIPSFFGSMIEGFPRDEERVQL